MNPFLLLAATTAGPSRGSLPPSAPIDILTDYVNLPVLDELRSRDIRSARDFCGLDHVHQGRLKHQYAKQPRASSHRICRGRP